MSNPISSSAPRARGPGPWIALLLVIAGAVLARAATADFIDLDDELYVLNNPHVLTGMTPANLAWALTTTRGGNWSPLTWWSLQLDATLTGPPPPRQPGPMGPPPRPRPLIYHIDNLLQHLAAAVLLFLLLDSATKRRWASFAVALVWAIHPLRVESVAWVTERKDVAAGLFGFLAIYLYIRWTQRGAWPLYAGFSAAFLLSLMAKPLFITLPFLLLLLDAWPLGRLRNPKDLWKRATEKGWLFALMAAFVAIALVTQQSAHAVMSEHGVGIGPRAENALLSYVRYLWMQVSFARLGIYYPYLGRAPAWQLAAAAVLLAAITALCLWQRKGRPWVLVGWLWYLGAFVPMVGIVQVGEQAYADRYTYLPSVGLFVMLFFSIPTAWLAASRVRWASAGLAVVAAILAGFTIRQLGYWQNAIALDQRTLAVTRDNYMIHSTLGAAWMRERRPDLAFASYQEALRINPDFAEARVGLGALYLMMRQPQAAAEQFAAAVRADPANAQAHNLYGIALASTGRIDGAVAEFTDALKLSPNDANVRANLQRALAAREQQMRHPPTTRPVP